MMETLLVITFALTWSTSWTLSDDPSRAVFWLVSELESVGWRQGCLTTAGCAQPRFQLTFLNAITSEKLSKSWLIMPKVAQERQRFYVTHWSDGTPSDIQISCEVVGVDPTYGFPRICDSSTSVRIYQDEEKKGLQERPGKTSLDRDGKVIIVLRARCFNSTIIMERYEERCPWCVEYSDCTVTKQQDPESLKSSLKRFFGDERQLYILLAAFALIAALSSALFSLAFYLHVRQNRNSSSGKCQRCGENGAKCVLPNGSAQSTRYDIPWDSKYRPLPKWTSCRSNCSSASPADTSSTFTAVSQHSKPTKVVVGSILYETNSLNSSIYEKPDDSDSGCV